MFQITVWHQYIFTPADNNGITPTSASTRKDSTPPYYSCSQAQSLVIESPEIVLQEISGIKLMNATIEHFLCNVSFIQIFVG